MEKHGNWYIHQQCLAFENPKNAQKHSKNSNLGSGF